MKRSSRTLSIPLAWTLALALAASACAVRTEAPTPFVERGETNILITVDNQDFRDATLYVNWNGTKQRVGMVTGKTTETFTTPWRDFQVRLEVDFVVGGDGYGVPVTDPIAVSAGEHIDYIIMPGW